jgi:hypothetical protein
MQELIRSFSETVALPEFCELAKNVVIDHKKQCFATFNAAALGSCPFSPELATRMKLVTQYMVAAFAPLSTQQAASLTHLDARLIWLYDCAHELQVLLHLLVTYYSVRGRTVPASVSVCAAWLMTCAQTSFLTMDRGCAHEWCFTFKSQYAFYSAIKRD